MEAQADWSYFRLLVPSPELGSGCVFESPQGSSRGFGSDLPPQGEQAVCSVAVTRGSHRTLGRLLTVEKLKLLENSRVSLLPNRLILSH